MLVPGGFGSRGWEGKILACRVARERGIPYLGICLGMHVAVSEFARHVVGLEGANSTEMDPETPYPVIDLLPEQKEIEDLGGTMRLGAQAVELAEGTRARRDLRRAGRPRAAPPPLRGEQPLPPAARRRRARRLRDVPGGAARRDRRAARPPVVRRQPVPPGVQVAADAARRRSSASSSAPRTSAPAPAARSSASDRLSRGRGGSSSTHRRAGCGRGSGPLPRARRAAVAAGRGACGRRPRRRRAARARPRGRRGRRRRADRLERGQPLLPARADRRGDAALPLRAPRHRAADRRRSSRSSRTASSATPAGRSSAPTTSPRSWRWSRRRGGVVEEGRPHAGLELVFTPKEEVGLARRRRRSTARGSPPGSGYVYDQAGPIGEVILGAPNSAVHGGHLRRPARRTPAWRRRRGARRSPPPARAIADMRLGRLDEETTRERRHDPGRGRAQHRPRPVHLQRGGALARRAEARRRRPGDARRLRLRRRPWPGARSRPRSSRGFQRLPLPQGATSRCGSRAAALERTGHEPALRALRRRCGRERLQPARPRLPQPRERDGRDPHARRSTSPSPTSRRWSTSRSRSSRRRVPLSLRRGARHRGARAARGARADRGGRRRLRRVPAADRPGRARRRGASSTRRRATSGSAPAGSTSST